MEALIHHIQNQLSQHSLAQPQSSEMEPPRLVSAIASTRDDLIRVDITTTINISDIVKIGYEDAESGLLRLALSIQDIGVADGFTDLDQPFTLIYKSDEDLDSDAQLQPFINQYKRLRDAVFKGDMKPITAVNSGGHWSYVEPANPQGDV